MVADRLRGLTRSARDMGGSGLAALGDQAVVSGMSFAVTILLGRLAGPAELGLYSLAITLALLTVTAQDSLITLPYTIFGRRLAGDERRQYAGSSVALCVGLSLMAMVAGLAAFALSKTGILASHLAPALGLWAVVAPIFLLREFARRFLFAELQFASALQFDVSVAGIQVLLLAIFVGTGTLSAGAAGVALSLAVAAAVAVSYWRSDAFIIERRKVGPTFVQNWRFGQWVLAGRAVSLLNSDVLVIWLIAVLAGPAASGMFTACMGVVFFSNPFVLGVSNLLVPRIAQAHAQGGTTALHRAVAQTTWILGAPVAGFCLLLVVCADWALHALYGDAFAGQGPTVVALALGTLASVLGMGASNGLWVLGRPKANTLSSGAGLVITVATAGLLLPRWHTLGAAIGLLAGLGSESIVRNLFFRHYLRMARTAELIPVAAPYAESVAS